MMKEPEETEESSGKVVKHDVFNDDMNKKPLVSIYFRNITVLSVCSTKVRS